MSFETPISLSQALTRALRRLAQSAHKSSWDQWVARQLTPSQRNILALLASRESLSLRAVAHELGVSPSTASESVRALADREFVRKERNTTDDRSLALVLTKAGQQLAKELAELPDPLSSAFDELPTNEQETLYRLSIKMIRGLEEHGALPTSRMCVRCKSFDPFRHASSSRPHHCDRAKMRLAESELRIDCAIFEAGDAVTQSALWEKFVAGSDRG